MKNVIISPSSLFGRIPAIASKSDLHRLMICAAFAQGETKIHGVTISNDILATASCLEALGAKITFDDGVCSVLPKYEQKDSCFLDCGESGSTLRFLLPIACTLCENVSVTGSGRLPARPIGELIQVLKSGGVSFEGNSLPLKTHGRFHAGNYEIPGNISSQYISGLLFALSLIPEHSTVTLTTPLESASYVDMTISALERFGVKVNFENNTYHIEGKEHFYSPKKIHADGDWSNSAFFLICGAIGERITVTGLDTNSLQGDKKILEILERFGAKVEVFENEITVSRAKLRGCTVDLKDIPDTLPALSVLACFAEGETRFTGGSRLRLKESDRIDAVANMINALGGSTAELEDGLTVTGTVLSGGTVDSENDHRIAMAASVAAAYCKEKSEICGADAVNKSYPDFYKDFEHLGGKINV